MKRNRALASSAATAKPRGQAAYRLIIAGGRDFGRRPEQLQDFEQGVRFAQGKLFPDISLQVVSGMAKGADELGANWARQHGLTLHEFPAQWDKLDASGAVVRQGPRGAYNALAGFQRNQQMADNASGVLLFEGGRGTADMAKRAAAAGLDIYDFRVPSKPVFTPGRWRAGSQVEQQGTLPLQAVTPPTENAMSITGLRAASDIESLLERIKEARAARVPLTAAQKDWTGIRPDVTLGEAAPGPNPRSKLSSQAAERASAEYIQAAAEPVLAMERERPVAFGAPVGEKIYVDALSNERLGAIEALLGRGPTLNSLMAKAPLAVDPRALEGGVGSFSGTGRLPSQPQGGGGSDREPPAPPRKIPGAYADPSMESDDVRRYAHMFGKDFLETVTEVPLGGVLRALAENMNMDRKTAQRIEQGVAGLLAAGVGGGGLLLAADALNGNDQPIIVRV